MNSDEQIRQAVKERYAGIAESAGQTSCSGCCESVYTPEEISDLPQEALLGLGCGAPVRLADIRSGETVLDLGSGGGVDVFLAARLVGPAGRVIGVDMTSEMVGLAQSNAIAAGAGNVEFRHGMIEDLPVASGSVDVILSNCVINLSPDKSRVFAEAFRALKPGGRLVVSDMVSQGTPPRDVTSDLDRWAGCIAGALPEEDYLNAIRSAGFASASVISRNGMDTGQVYSVTVRADKSPEAPS